MGQLSSTEVVTTLPAGTGHDHAALALLPFSIASRTGEVRAEPVTVAYQAEVDGKIRRVNITLRPGSELTLPTPGDQMVFLGLLQLALRRDPPEDVLQFQRQDVIDVLGWTDGGRNYERLRESLERLVNLTIKVNVALISRDGREYHREEEASHIIERYRLGNRNGPPCHVEWGHLVREAFRLGDFKRLDWNLLIALGNPLTGQLYRLLDRVTLAGETQWTTGWKSLAQALGMGTGYDRPAKFRDKLQPHIDNLIEHGVIDGYDYLRGGKFTFHIRNYLRVELRRALIDLGVYPDAAAQLLAGHDETDIMLQCDCLEHGSRPRPEKPGGYLVEAIRERYDVRYPSDEPETFMGIWHAISAEERTAYHRAGVWLLGAADSLFATNADPEAWPLELRAVTRFMVIHTIDPDLVGRRPTAQLMAS